MAVSDPLGVHLTEIYSIENNRKQDNPLAHVDAASSACSQSCI